MKTDTQSIDDNDTCNTLQTPEEVMITQRNVANNKIYFSIKRSSVNYATGELMQWCKLSHVFFRMYFNVQKQNIDLKAKINNNFITK